MTLVSRVVFQNKNSSKKILGPKIQIENISIVIPVKNNQHGIDRYLLHFFESQKDNPLPKEIIIIDNNSDTEINISTSYLNRGIPIKVIKCIKKGPAAARNMGVNISTGEWILFNDSDCIPTRDLITGYISSENGSIGYAGNIKSYSNDLISNYYESQEILIPLKSQAHNNEYSPQYLITANCLVLKSALEKIKGFDESITIAAGEDIDMGIKLTELGRLSYSFNSIVYHDFNDGWRGFRKRFIRYGEGNKIIEDIWKVNMRPYPFKPNHKTFFNIIAAKMQFVWLTVGYYKAKYL